MNIKNKKINYINDIEIIEKKIGNFEYSRNSFQDYYFSFYENGNCGEYIRYKI